MKPSFLSPNEVCSAISCQLSSSKSAEASSGGSASIHRPSPLLGGAGIHEPSPLFGGSDFCQPSPTVDLMAEATDACAAFRQLSPPTITGLSGNGTTFIPCSFLFAPVQNNGVAEDISASVVSSTVDDSGIASGLNRAKDFR
jgi:Flp pilus assembly secretin CpaC